jgi:hypothetical protein
MTVLRKINSWLLKHWSVLWHKPNNGELAAREIEPILREMRGNNDRVNKALVNLTNDIAAAQRMVADEHVADDPGT